MIAPLFFFATLCTGLYVLLLLIFMRGWNKLPEQNPENQPPRPIVSLSVIVPCHNEAAHLPDLMQSLANQAIAPNEIIFIDDNSTDGTAALLAQYAAAHPHVRMLSATDESSKKRALALGIKAATSELVLCTDADCTVPETWTETVLAAYAQAPFDLLILPVLMRGDRFFTRLQQLEFASLIASTVAMAAWGHPIMCNGANLAFRRKEWLESQADLHTELPSGDDMFLLHSFKKRGLRIRALKAKAAMVQTEAAPDVRSFFRQRGRWTSKAGSYTDADTIAVALLIFAMNAVMLLLPASAFFSRFMLGTWLVVFVVKWLMDGIFLKIAQPFFGYRQVGLMSFCLSVVYPFYVLGSVLCGLCGKKRKRR